MNLRSHLIQSFGIHNLNTMNKTNLVHNSQNNFPLKQYLLLAKSSSKEKPTLLERKSKSPPRVTTSPKHIQNSQDWTKLQKRYHELQDKYTDLLEIVKNRNSEYDRLKIQVQNYKKMHERDSEQIQKLRFIIGLAKKKSVQVQVDEVEFQTTNGDPISRINKFDQSTQDEIKMRQSGEKFKFKDKFLRPTVSRNLESEFEQNSRSKYNISSPLFSSKHTNQNTQKVIETGRFRQKLSNSPYAKFRFVPEANY